jgi:hypothetical protein
MEMGAGGQLAGLPDDGNRISGPDEFPGFFQDG